MYKNIFLLIIGFFLLARGATPAYAVVGKGDIGGWNITYHNTQNPTISFGNLDFFTENCTNITIMCGGGGHIYTVCKRYDYCVGVFPAVWSSFSGGAPLPWESTQAVGVYIGNSATGQEVYTGSTDWPLDRDPAPYKMNATVKASGSALMGSMGSTLFGTIVKGVGIVGGAVTTLFGLRWLIGFVRGML